MSQNCASVFSMATKKRNLPQIAQKHRKMQFEIEEKFKLKKTNCASVFSVAIKSIVKVFATDCTETQKNAILFGRIF